MALVVNTIMFRILTRAQSADAQPQSYSDPNADTQSSHRQLRLESIGKVLARFRHHQHVFDHITRARTRLSARGISEVCRLSRFQVHACLVLEAAQVAVSMVRA